MGHVSPPERLHHCKKIGKFGIVRANQSVRTRKFVRLLQDRRRGDKSVESHAESIGNRIAELRRRKGWTQEDVGSFIKRTGGHISNVENGRTELSPSELEKLATEFEVNPLYLIAGITNDLSEVVAMVAKMDPAKRRQALKLFRLNLGLMEINKNWPADSVNA
jgi:transcriptional regulator with XRE-family HTH domain